jgi:hypothetical protein
MRKQFIISNANTLGPSNTALTVRILAYAGTVELGYDTKGTENFVSS